MTVNSYLTALASDLVLSPDEKSSISTSIFTLQSRLNSHFGGTITQHFQFGSSTRGTILPRKADSNSDVDYMVVFDTSRENQMKPQTYLDRLKRFATAKYSTSEIHQSSPTIVLSLNHIKFELVPAVYTYNYGYQIPSPETWREWIPTDPSQANQDLQIMNQSNDYLIKPLVRLIKYWNASQGHLYASFKIEQFIVREYFILCSSMRDYFYRFWESIGCTADTPQYIKNKVETAKQRAATARQLERDGLPYPAENEVRKMLPPL